GFVTVVAGPAAEPGDGPPGPGQGIGRMRILLLGSALLQLLLEGVQDLNLGSVEDVAGRLVSSTGGAREHELHGDDGGEERNDHKLFESLPVLDDALLDAQPLTLKGSKQLLDVPAQAIPADHR